MTKQKERLRRRCAYILPLVQIMSILLLTNGGSGFAQVGITRQTLHKETCNPIASPTVLISAAVEGGVHGASKPTRFFTKWQAISLSVGAAMMTADLVSTHEALQHPGAHEANPLMQNSAAAIGLKVGLFGASVGISYALHRAGHDRAARVLPIVFGMPSMAVAVHNFSIR